MLIIKTTTRVNDKEDAILELHRIIYNMLNNISRLHDKKDVDPYPITTSLDIRGNSRKKTVMVPLRDCVTWPLRDRISIRSLRNISTYLQISIWHLITSREEGAWPDPHGSHAWSLQSRLAWPDSQGSHALSRDRIALSVPRIACDVRQYHIFIHVHEVFCSQLHDSLS